MFTGIVTHVGRVERVEPKAGGDLRLVVAPEQPMAGLQLGGSIAVDGVCLTLVDQTGALLAFDVVPETLRRSTLGGYVPGRRVNLERALRLGEELGGHFVQGHVLGTAELTQVERKGADVRLSLRASRTLEGGAVAKGSITLDGVSLTVGEVWREPGAAGGECFSVYLIPHTLAVTTLSERRVGERLNVEVDLLWQAYQQRLREAGGAAGAAEGSGR